MGAAANTTAITRRMERRRFIGHLCVSERPSKYRHVMQKRTLCRFRRFLLCLQRPNRPNRLNRLKREEDFRPMVNHAARLRWLFIPTRCHFLMKATRRGFGLVMSKEPRRTVYQHADGRNGLQSVT